MRAELPAGTVTFLFTDVEGSTKLLHALGAEAYADALAEHRRAIRAACAAEGGVEVDTQGDAFFFAFPTASGAVSAAAVVTKALSSGPVQVRVGLHTGTPLLAEEGYVGDDVHLAARVAASAHGGQVVLSQATATLIEESNSLLQSLSLADLGEHRLKDIAEPVVLYQLGDGAFPPLKTISNTNLPRPTGSFVGRERELEEVLARIEQGARLVTLTGPGGSGKTRLALEAAAGLVPCYKAGVFWIGLAALRDPALVAQTIGQTLGAKNGVAEHVGEREMLLLLDNLEQVVEAAPELAALVEACPHLTLLVTSRELLRVRGEVEFPVPPLAEPEAVALFCERAQLEPSEEITALCARLDSLPLAVELAAARTKALSPAQILDRLAQRLDLLKGGRDAEARHATLRTTIEWSYELLTEPEQQFFRRLAVFRGGSTLEAAEEVAGADLDTLQSLIEKSLLRRSNERYWMLETIREYALERLDAAGEGERVRGRLLEHMSALADDVYDQFGSLAAGLSVVATEHDNIREALDWSESARPDLSARLAGAVAPFWTLRGHVTEARDRLVEALAGHPSRDRVRARALTHLAGLAWIVPEHDALAYLADALEIYRKEGDVLGEALALENVGHVSSDPAAARSAFEQSLALLEQARAPELAMVGALAGLCQLLVSQGDVEAAEPAAQELYEIGLKNDAIELRGDALHFLADCPLLRGEYAEAAVRYRRALASARAAGFEIQCTNELLGVAMATVGLGDPARGVFLAEVAYLQREALGIPRFRPDFFWGRLQEWYIGGARALLAPNELEAADREARRAGFDDVVDGVLVGLVAGGVAVD